MAERRFDRVFLFSTPRMAERTEETRREIEGRYPGAGVEVVDIALKDPTHYAAILRRLRPRLRKIYRQYAASEAEHFISVASGTPQMHACWLLLAASGEFPAVILQTTPPEFVPAGGRCVKEVDLSAQDFPRIAVQELGREDSAAEDELAAVRRELGIVGDDPLFLRALGEAATFAEYDETHVLLLGETGTGKECFTRLIHHLSERSRKPLVTLNCGSIPDGLAESQLFGHKRGSFTGASADHPGKFAAADGGILFLDELGELPTSVQAKLLRALEHGEIEPLGTARPKKVDVRVVAATNRDLRQMVADGAFREDLYQRFGATVAIPPLRQRKADIPALALHLLGEWNRRYKKQRSLNGRALEELTRQAWPGNIRELRRTLHQAAMLCPKGTLTDTDLRFDVPISSDATVIPEPDPGFRINPFLDSMKRRIVDRAIEKENGVQAKAARLLGWSPQALSQYLKSSKYQDP